MTSEREHRSRRYNFASWQQAGKQDEYLFIWRFRLSGREVNGWVSHRLQSVESEATPPAIISVWRPARESAASLISIDIYETESRDAARAHLLVLLGEFQGPPLKRLDAPGAVAFSPGPSAILFARANLVVFVRSVERELAPVGQVADQLDRQVTSHPEVVEAGGPDIRTFRPAVSTRLVVGRPIPLLLEAQDPTGQPVYFKLFSRSGEFRLEQGRPAYVPVSPGSHEITVYAVGASGAATRRALSVE